MNLKFLRKHLPIILITTILYSFYTTYLYYHKFGINITYYLETTEIVFGLSNSLVMIILPTIIIGLYFNIYYTISKSESNFNFTVNSLSGTQLNIFILFILILMKIPDYFLSTLSDYYHLYLISQIFIISSLIYFVSDYNKFIFFTPLLYLILFAFVIFYPIRISNAAYTNTVDLNKPKFSAKLILQDSTIESATDYYFIGNTNNYFFFYNSQLKQVDVFSSNSIKYHSIKKNRGGL